MSVGEKLATIAENEQKVYDAGKNFQYHKFWDNLQQYGQRKEYIGAFSRWNKTLFKPKYDMQPTKAMYMFENFRTDIDMVELLKECDVTLDFSKCTNFQNFLMWSHILRLGVIDTRSAAQVHFYYAYMLKTIDRLILKDDGSQTFSFESCPIQNITIEGVIGKNINLKWSSKITHDSLISIINALSTTATKQTVTFSKTAINNAFGIDIDDETTYPEGSEFYNLRNTKSNWNFSYV